MDNTPTLPKDVAEQLNKEFPFSTDLMRRDKVKSFLAIELAAQREGIDREIRQLLKNPRSSKAFHAAIFKCLDIVRRAGWINKIKAL